MMLEPRDFVEYLLAVSAACPEGAPRDRFGRLYLGGDTREPLRLLAIKYHLTGSFDTFEQAAQIARAMLLRIDTP